MSALGTMVLPSFMEMFASMGKGEPAKGDVHDKLAEWALLQIKSKPDDTLR